MKRLLPALLVTAALSYPALAGVMETDGSPSPNPTPTPTPEAQQQSVAPRPVASDPLVDAALSLVTTILSLL